MYKKIFIIALALCLCAGMLSGCNLFSKSKTDDKAEKAMTAEIQTPDAKPYSEGAGVLSTGNYQFTVPAGYDVVPIGTGTDAHYFSLSKGSEKNVITIKSGEKGNASELGGLGRSEFVQFGTTDYYEFTEYGRYYLASDSGDGLLVIMANEAHKAAAEEIAASIVIN